VRSARYGRTNVTRRQRRMVLIGGSLGVLALAATLVRWC
jgi:hypothetical protein